MASRKTLLGGAGATALAVRVARSLHARWRFLPAADRERLAPLAKETKDGALDLRGATDRALATTDLRASSERLAQALVKSAEADPEVPDGDVDELREELRRELGRLAEADVKPSRSSREAASPPG